MSKENIEFIITKLTELLIKQDFEEKSKKQTIYVKKSQVYKDLINFFKQINT